MTPVQKVKLNSLIQKLVATELKAHRFLDADDGDSYENERAAADKARKRLTNYIDGLTG